MILAADAGGVVFAGLGGLAVGFLFGVMVARQRRFTLTLRVEASRIAGRAQADAKPEVSGGSSGDCVKDETDF